MASFIACCYSGLPKSGNDVMRTKRIGFQELNLPTMNGESYIYRKFYCSALKLGNRKELEEIKVGAWREHGAVLIHNQRKSWKHSLYRGFHFIRQECSNFRSLHLYTLCESFLCHRIMALVSLLILK